MDRATLRLAAMRFFKAHGTANDFVVVRDLDDGFDPDAVLVRALCDRRRGIGADGVLRLGAPTGGGDVFMDYRNADGSIVEMCGNGVRVVAKHVVDHGLVAGPIVRVETRAGIRAVHVRRGDDGRVVEATVDMGPPAWEAHRIPFQAGTEAGAVEILDLGEGDKLAVTAVSMGNPHAVTLVDDVSAAPVTDIGPRVEHDARFPEGVNVEFAQVMSPGAIRLRVWERGVGETAACGTGACAAVVALQRRGQLDDRVAVRLPGGTLRIDHDGTAGVQLTGAAVEVAAGEVDAGWLAAASAGAWDREVTL